VTRVEWVAESQPFIALALLGGILVAFIAEKFPPEITAIGSASLFLALGLTPAEEALAVLSNSAIVTIAAMFVLSGALVRTGVLNLASRIVLGWAERRPSLALTAVLGSTLVASSVMNNTPIVIVLIPVVVKLAQAIGEAPSRLLIPLSYAAILGGTCTLIGTSTNLVVDGIARGVGLAPFGILEITPLGVALAAVGGAFLAFASRFLPARMTMAAALSRREAPHFVTEITIPRGSPLRGKTPSQITSLATPDVILISVRRRGQVIRNRLESLELRIYDRLRIAAPADELLTLHEQAGLNVGHSQGDGPKGAKKVIEALVAPGRTLAGHQLGALRLPQRFAVYPLAIRRHGKLTHRDLNKIKLQVGDAILVEGEPEGIAEMAETFDFLNLSHPSARALRRHKAPIALVTPIAVIALAAAEVLPIAALALIGASIVLITRCVSAEEAIESVDGRILVLIIAMLIVGAGIESSGALELIAGVAGPLMSESSPLVALAVVYVLTSILTEIVSNTAVAVIVTPLAAGIAAQLGLDPRPFVVAVMFAASASFATPIGYQTNTLVYSAGGYRFTDFLLIGLPMNIIAGVVCITLIPWIWPLRP
jgi:di/tricarboxylate transporter